MKKITVTKEDIQNGQRNSRSACPLGLAIKRQGIVHCCVTETAVVLRDSNQRVTALLLPDPVQTWISNFHQAKPVEPISFELGIPLAAVCDGRCPDGQSPSGRCSRRNGQAKGHA